MGWTARYVLENEKGERKNLTAPEPIYLVAVEGLGIATRRTFGSIGHGFFLLTADEVPQEPITGDLIYQLGAYENYEVLVNWIAKSKTLYFCYTPLETEYRCKVKLNFIQKDRRDSAGWMRAAISFYPLTPWYELFATTAIIETGGADSKAYLEHDGSYYYTYDDALVYGPESSGDLTRQISPAGHEPSGLLLRFKGAITNPVISLVGNSGTVYGECHINDTFSSTQTLELCTAPDNSYVRKIDSSGNAIDLMALSKVDLSFEPYPRAPVDEPCTLTISADEFISGSADVTIFRYYRSV